MALNIYLENGAIKVYEDGENPRVYWGGLGASGKFYPSGTSGAVKYSGFEIASSTIADAIDSDYDDVPSTTNSTSGTPSDVLFYVQVVDGVVTQVNLTNGQQPSYASGYAIGDLFTIQGSSLGGGSGELIVRVTSLDIDGLLIVIGGDYYSVKWYDLKVDDVSATSLLNAQELLATLFSSL